MDGAKIGIFKQRDKVGLNGFLERTDSRRLEAEVRFEVLSDFTDQTLERQLADQELSRLLVTTNLTEGDSSRLIAVRLLDTAGRWRGFTRSFGRELLTRGLATSGFTCE